MYKLITLLLVSTVLVQNANSARILCVCLIPSYSHQMFYQLLWRELAIRGHDVVVLTTDPTNEVLPNLKEISIREAYVPMKKNLDVFVNSSLFTLIWEDKWTEMVLDLLEFELNLPQVHALINNKEEHFDLLMLEHFVSSAVGLQYRFNCSLIGVFSMDGMSISHDTMGNPDHFTLYPSALVPALENLSFLQRLQAVAMGLLMNYMQYKSFGKMTDQGRKFFGKDMPPIGELLDKTDMLFVNSNPLFSAVRPHTPSTISIAGGMHMRAPKPLPEKVKDFLDNAKNGAIYFSLGSNVKSNELTLSLRQTIMNTLSQVPYKVLWKYEDDTLPDKPDNVMIIKWTPQQDVLRHKNIKLFVTQGGIQSLEETLYSHVPIVVIPFFGDQEANAHRAKSKGLGVVLDRHSLTVEDFKAAINEVIDNSMYKKAVEKFATQIQDTPRTPLENAVWWTEYVLRHKDTQHLKGPKIPFYQYFYLDILTFLGGVVTILFIMLFSATKYSIQGVCSLLKSSKKKPTKKGAKKLKTN